MTAREAILSDIRRQLRRSSNELPPPPSVRLRIPAREVILAHTDIGAFAGALSLHNVLPGTVKGIAAHPARHAALVEVAVGDASLLSRVTPDAVARLGLVPGAE